MPALPQSGNSIIDQHHASLSQLVSQLAHSWMLDISAAEFSRLTDRFQMLLAEHFHSEISIIRAAGYEHWQRHEEEHDYILRKLEKLANRGGSNHIYEYVDEAERTIFEHELLSDQEYWDAFDKPTGDELVHWDETLELNDPEIDKHHQALVGYLNRMYLWLRDEPYQREVLMQDFVQLYRYTRMHFELEEEMILKAGDAISVNHSAHVRDHARLLGELRLVMQKLKQQQDAKDVLMTMRDFVRYWLVDHIHVHDKPAFQKQLRAVQS